MDINELLFIKESYLNDILKIAFITMCNRVNIVLDPSTKPLIISYWMFRILI